MVEPIDIPDADIEHAITPIGRLYTDASIFDSQLEHLFPRSWQFVSDMDPVRVPQQFHPFSFLEGGLDEPLLLTRDEHDRLHCMSNVCTHRGTLVCESPGNARTLTCRYHGRRFALDGSFKSMPEFEKTKSFPRPEDDLAKVPFAVWRDFIFTSLSPSIRFDDLMEPLDSCTEFLPIEEARFDPARSRDYLVHCNWALYVENYLEGFHIPYVHASLAEAIDYGEYRTELYEHSNLQIGVSSGGDEVFDLPSSHPLHGTAVAAFYFWLFPNTMVNVYPWGISVNVVKPLSVDRTKVSFLSYVWDSAKLDRGAGSDLDRVEREDEAVVETVQRGLRSRLYPGGRYSPTREQGVHHFHRLLTTAMARGGSA